MNKTVYWMKYHSTGFSSQFLEPETPREVALPMHYGAGD
jgi:hypothetical protein